MFCLLVCLFVGLFVWGFLSKIATRNSKGFVLVFLSGRTQKDFSAEKSGKKPFERD